MPELRLGPADRDVLTDVIKSERAVADCLSYAVQTLRTDLRGELRPMYEHHERSVKRLEDMMRRCGGELPERPGPTSNLVLSLEHVASALGERACLIFLEEQEHRHVAQCRRGARKATDPTLKALIAEALLPATMEHRADLDRLIWSLRPGAGRG